MIQLVNQMNRQKFTLADTPIGYTHTNESIIGEYQWGTLQPYMYFFHDDNTTLICGDAGNGNYDVVAKFGKDTSLSEPKE